SAGPCRPFGRTLARRLGKRLQGVRRVEVPAVDGRSRLLPPGLRDRTGVYGVESELLHDAVDQITAGSVRAGDGESNPVRRAIGRPALKQMLPPDSIEDFVD